MTKADDITAPERHRTVEAGEGDDGLRLDKFLARSLPELSRSRIQALIKDGHASLGGETIRDGKHRVKPGDVYDLVLPPPEPLGIAAQAIPLDILYEDDALIVIDKPAGLVVHPGAGNPDNTLVNALIAHCGDSLSGIGGVARPGIVHRLDKDTSGVLVVAKTDQAHKGLAAQFADHGIEGDLERRYLALVWGVPRQPFGTVEAAIGRHPTSRTKMAVVKEDRPDARHAVTHYRVLETYGENGKSENKKGESKKGEPVAALVECTLETGRTHQVRLHMAHLGTPLIGDPLYAQGFKTKLLTLPPKLAEAAGRLHRQALHAAHLSFEHPVSGEFLEFDSPPPGDLAELIAAFKEL